MTTASQTLIDLLEQLRGGKTQVEWAAELGVSQSVVSDWLAGHVVPKRTGAEALLKRYPAHREDLVRLLFLAGEGNDDELE